MKKTFITLILFFLFSSSGSLQSQLLKTSWSLEGGLSYPKLMSTNIVATESNYGLYASIQRNFSEHVGLRFLTGYSHLEGYYGIPHKTCKSNSFAGNIDLIYYFVPCEPVTPYFSIGIGSIYASLTNRETTDIEDSFFDYAYNLGFGSEWRMTSEVSLKANLNYCTVANSRLDGSIATYPGGGIFGGNNDSFISICFGVSWYFSKGAPSEYCQLYYGLKAAEMLEPIDYAKIEEIFMKHLKESAVKEVVVEKPAQAEKWVLVSINFDSQSAKLKPEAYPILLHNLEVLFLNPDLVVEIQGYTDATGQENFNQELSVKRAQAVKDFFTARSITENRLKVLGFGSNNYIGDNNTPEGRFMNRRVEFKVLSQ